jgi:hypothetical protein
MPIRESERARYPKDWSAISRRIRERSGQTCECTGQCGSFHVGGPCAAPNWQVVIRPAKQPERWTLHEHTGACLVERCDQWGGKAVLIVLTVAHLNHTPEDVSDGNLVAMCQRCHLRMDSPHHQQNAANTRRTKADAASGQIGLFGKGPR